jgi:hypothetical protein
VADRHRSADFHIKRLFAAACWQRCRGHTLLIRCVKPGFGLGEFNPQLAIRNTTQPFPEKKIPRSRPYDSHREFCHRRYDDGREPGRV